MRASNTWILLGGAVILAAAVGRWSAPAAPPAPVSAPTRAASAPAMPPVVRAVAPRTEIRYVTAPPTLPAAAVAADDRDAEPASPTAAQEDAADRALALVDQAIGRATWTEGDWAQLDALMPEMAPEQRRVAMRALGVAINDGAVIPETPHAMPH